MLRSMVFQNFVHFEDRFHLNFSTNKDKPFFFIGASSTGKTVVLELIRRCLGSSMNSSLTSRSDESKLAFVFCEFELFNSNIVTGLIIAGKENTYYENMTKTDHKEMKTEENTKHMVKNEKQEKREDAMSDEKPEHTVVSEKAKRADDLEFYKIIVYTDNGQLKLISRTFYERTEDGKSHLIDTGKNVIVSNIVMKKTKETTDIDVNAILEQIRQKIDNNEFMNTDGKPEELWDDISNFYVGILPNRGLGSLQWTRSKQFGENYKDKNYRAACEHAEIINDYIDKEGNVSEVFKFLTSPNTFEFKRGKDGNIVVSERKASKVKEFPLLKTPFGILEAKQFSLVIEDDRFQTITLEEPENGMHPQMIERMKVMLYNNCVNKTVIIVTHCPDLIEFLSMKNTFIFHRIEDPTRIRHALKKFDDNEIDDVSKICGMENLKRIFFSSKVLLVEGKSDKLILETIFRNIFENSKDLDVHNILSHYIIALDGFGMAKAVQTVCREINVQCKTIFDRDVFLKIDGQGLLEEVDYKQTTDDCKQSTEEYSEFIEKPVFEFLEHEQGFQKLSDKLKKENVFIWKDGDLEDFLISDKSQRQKIYDLLHVKTTTKTRRKELKKTIKNQINEHLSQREFEELGKTIYTFKDAKRLLEFLDDKK